MKKFFKGLWNHLILPLITIGVSKLIKYLSSETHKTKRVEKTMLKDIKKKVKKV